MRFARRGTIVKKKNGGNGSGGSKVNGKPPTMNERFDEMDKRFDAMDKRFDTIAKILKAHSLDIRNIKNGVAYLRSRVGRIEDHVGIGPPTGD